ncbi:transporter permease [Babesia ovata]|uniref:Transporter permease n=1 Tax=Babesia ovata TaxID=189622 RepID=A0A2H6K6K5_9APIC|nr:transporter permease [Babesia ovata]GBE58634.1 transporter permease [Babesia ovata]
MMGSESGDSILQEDIEFYGSVQHYTNNRADLTSADPGFYPYGIPVVKRNDIRNMAYMDTASTEVYLSQNVVRGDPDTAIDSESLLTVSLPYDDECDTDYEHSGGESSLSSRYALQGQEKEDESRSTDTQQKPFSINMELAIYMLIFVITNSAQPLLIFLLRQKGGTPNGTYTFLIPTYMAMICVGYYPTTKSIWEESWSYPLMLSGLDIVHQVVEKAGLVACGPSIYTIASSTNTMFLALLSSVVLRKRISGMTWASISLISGAIAISGLTQIEEITTTQIVGFFLVVIAALVNAFNSIISEDLLRKKKIEGPNLVCMMGMISLTIFFVWSLIFTIPQRHMLFDSKSAMNPFDLSSVLSILFVLFISNFFRSSVYYYIVKEAGSVCCGVLKAVRIIIVVAGSHALFSYADKSQVMTTGKVISSIVCSLGVIMYSVEHASIPKPKDA